MKKAILNALLTVLVVLGIALALGIAKTTTGVSLHGPFWMRVLYDTLVIAIGGFVASYVRYLQNGTI
mgnify:CR=1 FL=1